jgi:hypothetical protein
MVAQQQQQQHRDYSWADGMLHSGRYEAPLPCIGMLPGLRNSAMLPPPAPITPVTRLPTLFGGSCGEASGGLTLDALLASMPDLDGNCSPATASDGSGQEGGSGGQACGMITRDGVTPAGGAARPTAATAAACESAHAIDAPPQPWSATAGGDACTAAAPDCSLGSPKSIATVATAATTAAAGAAPPSPFPPTPAQAAAPSPFSVAEVSRRGGGDDDNGSAAPAGSSAAKALAPASWVASNTTGLPRLESFGALAMDFMGCGGGGGGAKGGATGALAPGMHRY